MPAPMIIWRMMRDYAPAALIGLLLTGLTVPALLVLLLDGNVWQINAHMHFFAVLAVLACLLDRRAIIVG